MVGEAGCIKRDECSELPDVDRRSCPRCVGCVVDAFALESVNDEFQKPRVVEFGLVVERSELGGVIDEEVVKNQCCAVVNECDGEVYSLDVAHECLSVWF